jgi:hypothetical protein
VEQLTWSIESAGIVNASPERVMAWWFGPDRKNEFRDRIERTGAKDFSLTEFITDGVRVRDTTWKDGRSWVHLHHTELHLGPDGMAPRTGDRFIASGSETVSFQHPRGKKFGFTCTARVEFVPQTSGATEIVVVHNHATTGGNWLARRLIRRSDLQKGTRQSDEESIARCREAVRA